MIQNEALSIYDNENIRQYDARPTHAKKTESCKETEQQNRLKKSSKSRIGKKIQLDCGENINNLQRVARNSDLLN